MDPYSVEFKILVMVGKIMIGLIIILYCFIIRELLRKPQLEIIQENMLRNSSNVKNIEASSGLKINKKTKRIFNRYIIYNRNNQFYKKRDRKISNLYKKITRFILITKIHLLVLICVVILGLLVHYEYTNYEFLELYRDNIFSFMFFIFFGLIFITFIFNLIFKFENKKLLILRVFNNSFSESLFNDATFYWRILGNRMFIVDQNFLLADNKQDFSLLRLIGAINPLNFFQRDNFLFYIHLIGSIVVFFMIKSIFTDLPFSFIISILMTIFLIVIYKLFLLKNIVRLYYLEKFNFSVENINKIFSNLNFFKSNILGVYKDLKFYCYDNVWRSVMSSSLKQADYILMDLRGFSADRLGCEFEIKKLFQEYNLNKILFIISNETELEFLFKFLNERSTKKNNIRFYKATPGDTSAEKKEDRLNIMNILLARL